MRIITFFVAVVMAVAGVAAQDIQQYEVKVGETVKLEIPSTGRALLSRATNKRGQWDVNKTYLQVVSSSWDHAYVKGLNVTNSTPVQLTVTFNMNGHYGDHYYAAYRVKVLPNGPTSITLNRHELQLVEGETVNLSASITGTAGTYKWYSDNPDVAGVSATRLNAVVTAKKAGVANITVSTANGKYTDTCRVTVSGTSGVDSVASESGVSMSGNCIDLGSTVYAELYDMNGVSVYQGETRSIDNLPKGIYVLKMKDFVEKIVIR